MEDHTNLHDWEVVIGSDLSGNLKSGVLREEAEDGIIKSDYFALDSVGNVRLSPEEKTDDVGENSDNPSWLEPDSGPWFAESSGGLSIKYSFWSDDSSEGRTSIPGSEKMVLESMGDSSSETASEVTDSRCENLGSEIVGSDSSGLQELVAVTGGSASSEEDENKRIWWTMPWKLFKMCIFRVRPVWSISVAVAMLGMVVLWRKLYRLKRKSRSIPLKIATDDKVSQFAARAGRLNNAVSVVRRMPILRPSLTSVGQWAALPLR